MEEIAPRCFMVWLKAPSLFALSTLWLIYCLLLFAVEKGCGLRVAKVWYSVDKKLKGLDSFEMNGKPKTDFDQEISLTKFDAFRLLKF